MVQKPKRRPARARSILSIAAAVAVTAAAVGLPAGASAAPTDPAGSSSADSTHYLRRAGDKPLPTKAPPGAMRSTKGPTAPGKRARAFSPRSTASPRIVGGTPVNSADYPGVVGIETDFLLPTGPNGELEQWFSICTGTVLSPTRVLTAGHCHVDSPYGLTRVIAGRNNMADDTSGFVARVGSTWTDPTYNYEAQLAGTAAPVDDVSVLTLKDALPAAYVPVTIADQGAADPADGTSATIVGYGVTASSASDYGILRAATVPIKADATCSAAWPDANAQFDGTRMLCAGTPPTTDTCGGDSGGPIFTGAAGSYVQVGVTDWGAQDCGSNYGVYSALNYYSDAVKAQITWAGANNLDWTGDGHSDLFARVASTGELWIASGSGFATNTFGGLTGFFTDDVASQNWNGYTKLFRVNNWSNDGVESVFARDSAGRLFNFRSDNNGGFEGGSLQIGTGWNMFVDIMVTNNWIGNGLPNLIGKTSDGKLVLYNADGHGGWLNPHGTQIGTGWNGFNTILTPGSWLGDGHQSLIGRKPNGELWLYNSNGSGGWTNPHGTRIGTGWSGFSTFLSPGDWSGDNNVDLMGVASNGDLRLYTTNGKGNWINGRGIVVDNGWNMFNRIF